MPSRSTQAGQDDWRPETCWSCRNRLPEGSLYCPSCGISQTEEIWEECEITCWRGYVVGEFVAVRLEVGELEEVGRSRQFRWFKGKNGPPEKRRAVARLAALDRDLEAAGWERSGVGDRWYEHRFRRSLGRNPAAVAMQPRSGAGTQ